ncbi:MAG TPA: SagB family peptide dehydrogenase, partial [Blastocatellia bacterium]|nr:SagB family peptide dehydrogenase [Blastocatellia bacterium]
TQSWGNTHTHSTRRNMLTEQQPGLSVDDAFEFACRLRADPMLMNDPGEAVEHSDAPWPFKVYEGGERLQLAGAGPWWLESHAGESDDLVTRLGALLFKTVACSRVRFQPGGTMLSSPQHPELVWPTSRLSVRRPVPSGGAMYPTEVYVAAPLSLRGAPTFYHYDPARHELTNLAYQRVTASLRKALNLVDDAPLSPLALILTHRFSKNLHKYKNFAYRLGAVDVGVVLGRFVTCGRELSHDVKVHVDFDDAVLNAMCGISGYDDESAYAVILLGEPQAVPSVEIDLSFATPRLIERGVPAHPSSLFVAMHAAACRHPSDLQFKRKCSPHELDKSDDLPVPLHLDPLPAPGPDVTSNNKALMCRTSNGSWFTGATLATDVLATVLYRTYEAVTTLRAICGDGDLPVVRLYCAVDRVDQIEPGWYRYLPDRHSLALVGRATSPATELQSALYAATVDVERSAFSLHVATVIDFRSDPRGVRAYRVQQFLVGAAIEAATRWSAAMGIGSHPLHGFDARRVDKCYGLSGDAFGVQAQVSIGSARASGSLEGSVIA